MKSLLLIFCCLLSTLSSAQENKATTNGLTKTELDYAKKLFISMMQSETYIKMNNSIDNLNKKSSIMYDDYEAMKKVKTRDDIKAIYKEWLKKNLKDTEYKSVEEGLGFHMESYDLTLKYMTENPEFFELLGRATASQIGEIMEPEHQARKQKALYPRH